MIHAPTDVKLTNTQEEVYLEGGIELKSSERTWGDTTAK